MKYLLLLILSFTALHTAWAKTNRYRCIWHESPATSMVIGWNQANGKAPVVELSIHKNDLESEGKDTVQQVLPYKTRQFKGMNNHFAKIENLLPNTVYYFRIKDSNSSSPILSFRTLPNDGSPISIIAGGDSRNRRAIRKKTNKMVAKLRPHLVMFGGDMTGLDTQLEWKNWLDDWQLTIGEDGRITPIVVARGNHERSNKVIHNLFDIPELNIYYGLTVSGNLARLYTLNSLINSGGKQKAWLEKDLIANINTRWKLAQYHHPMRPHTQNKHEAHNLQKNWAPLFYKYGVNLAIECDAHVVKTTYAIRPSQEKGSDEGFIRDDKLGTVYVGEGCWGAPLRRNNDDKSWTRASGSFNQFKWIWISYDKIEVRTVKTQNSTDITALTDGNRFNIPENLDIWTPETGDVVSILHHDEDKDATGDIEHHTGTTIGASIVPISAPSDQSKDIRKVIFFFLGIIVVAIIIPFVSDWLRQKSA